MSLNTISPLMRQALKRPRNYLDLSATEQWAIDKRLRILDWAPSDAELLEYQRLFAETSEEDFDSPTPVRMLTRKDLFQEARLQLVTCWDQAKESPSYNKADFSRLYEMIEGLT